VVSVTKENNWQMTTNYDGFRRLLAAVTLRMLPLAKLSSSRVTGANRSLQMGYNLKPTTPEEWTVIAVTITAVLTLTAVAAFVLLGRAETAEQASQLRWIGFCSLALLPVIWIIRKFAA
jgi:hypothetical protein